MTDYHDSASKYAWWGVVLHLKAANFWGVLIKVGDFRLPCMTLRHSKSMWHP